MENGNHSRLAGASDDLTRYLNGPSEAFVEPRFAALINDWYTHWGNSAWFSASPWRNRDRWVRFHYLPRSREYPRTARDDREIVRRYSEILAAVSEDDGTELTVVVESYSFQKSLPRRREPLDPGLRRILPMAAWLGVRRELDDFGSGWAHLWVTDHRSDDPTITSLFGAVTAQHESPIFMTAECKRLFMPYEGGVDVLLESSSARDSLADRFPDWLSPQREWVPKDDEQPL